MEQRHILIVDDEELLCVTVAGFLRDEGYAVKVMFDGLDVEKEVQQQQIDLILLDIMMPGISGMDVLNAVKKRSPKTRVIILSATGSEENIKKSKDLGADGFVSKPFGVETLVKHVRNVLSSPPGSNFYQPPIS
jgi:DNA-binding response OmpR family regulator